MRLGCTAYTLLQFVARSNRSREKSIIYSEYLRKGKSAKTVEIGCGDGSLAVLFQPKNYTGVDVSEERIESARLNHPGYAFYDYSVLSRKFEKLCKEADFFFCTAVLHHLSEKECIKLFNIILNFAKKGAVLVAMEPYRPENLWENPFSYIAAKLDEGKFVRTSREWQKLLKPFLVKTIELKGSFLWPVDGAMFRLEFKNKLK